MLRPCSSGPPQIRDGRSTAVYLSGDRKNWGFGHWRWGCVRESGPRWREKDRSGPVVLRRLCPTKQDDEDEHGETTTFSEIHGQQELLVQAEGPSGGRSKEIFRYFGENSLRSMNQERSRKQAG